MRLLIILLFSLPFISNAQSAVSGMATHSFNKNAPGLADAGAKVYIFKYDGDAIPFYETINNFLTAKNYRVLNNDAGRIVNIYNDSIHVVKGRRIYQKEYAGFQARIAEVKSATADRNAKLQVLNAETNIKFDGLDQQSAKALSQLKLKAGDMRSITEASGNFNIKIGPGKYGVLIISNNRTGFSTTEVSGKISLLQADVKEGETVKVSAHFIPD